MVQPLGKPVFFLFVLFCFVFTKLNIYLPCKTAVLLLDTYPETTSVHTKTCRLIVATVLLISFI